MLQIAIVAVIVVTSLYVIAVSSWTTLFSDQWRIYDTYFSVPFPESLLVSQNGHHPVFPGLLFFADIHMAGANNYLINTLGIALALALCIWWTSEILKDQELDPLMRLAATGPVWLATFWLGNARVLIHGNESLHVYPVLLALIAIATSASSKSQTSDGAFFRGWWIVIIAGLVATFSFGFGIIVWVVAAFLEWMVSRNVRRTFSLIAIMLAVLGLYLFGLPGSGSAMSITLAPLRILADSATWLGAPLVSALKPFANTSDYVDFFPAAAILGGFGLVATAILSLRRMWTTRVSSRLEAMAVATVLFGAGCSFLVALARGEYFAQFPGQVAAPRYIPWSSAFWAALLILGGLSIQRRNGGSPRLRILWVGVCAAIPFVLLPSQEGANAEYKKVQSRGTALGLLVGARDDLAVQQHLFPRPEVVYRVSQKLERRGLSVFSITGAPLLGRSLDDVYSTGVNPTHNISLGLNLELVNSIHGEPAARLSARLDRALAARLSSQILVTNTTGNIVGIGQVHGHRHLVARRLGLLGDLHPAYAAYVAPISAEETYTVYGVLDDESLAVPVATFGPEDVPRSRASSDPS